MVQPMVKRRILLCRMVRDKPDKPVEQSPKDKCAAETQSQHPEEPVGPEQNPEHVGPACQELKERQLESLHWNNGEEDPEPWLQLVRGGRLSAREISDLTQHVGGRSSSILLSPLLAHGAERDARRPGETVTRIGSVESVPQHPPGRARGAVGVAPGGGTQRRDAVRWTSWPNRSIPPRSPRAAASRPSAPQLQREARPRSGGRM
ncbi:uncharacterized protein LOC117764958 isoform X2 [Hippoglossus hippoglossus]|uniref:uncharacterized protein LOC117764958 isoform X2 n=1 Tax=Hippoglossus hippoglossus TaxID=8267 RepID=UPI00148E1591|nr:uncharacterized protein LOC117764958 isoform X2 [Hippoglossus hippoglossus]